jgi:hypothetical protein
MTKVRDFPRPKDVTVTIFEEAHALHRLTRVDVFTLVEDIMGQFQDTALELVTGGSMPPVEAIKLALRSGGPAFDMLLSRSFPTFKEWGELPIAHEVGLFDIVWDENDIPGILADFSRMKGKVGTLLPKVLETTKG